MTRRQLRDRLRRALLRRVPRFALVLNSVVHRDHQGPRRGHFVRETSVAALHALDRESVAVAEQFIRSACQLAGLPGSHPLTSLVAAGLRQVSTSSRDGVEHASLASEALEGCRDRRWLEGSASRSPELFQILGSVGYIRAAALARLVFLQSFIDSANPLSPLRPAVVGPPRSELDVYLNALLRREEPLASTGFTVDAGDLRQRGKAGQLLNLPAAERFRALVTDKRVCVIGPGVIEPQTFRGDEEFDCVVWIKPIVARGIDLEGAPALRQKPTIVYLPEREEKLLQSLPESEVPAVISSAALVLGRRHGSNAWGMEVLGVEKVRNPTTNLNWGTNVLALIARHEPRSIETFGIDLYLNGKKYHGSMSRLFQENARIMRSQNGHVKLSRDGSLSRPSRLLAWPYHDLISDFQLLQLISRQVPMRVSGPLLSLLESCASEFAARWEASLFTSTHPEGVARSAVPPSFST